MIVPTGVAAGALETGAEVAAGWVSSEAAVIYWLDTH